MIVLLWLSFLTFITNTVAQTPTTAQTIYGPVEGTLLDGVRSFKGIPYAAPPVESLRWQSPQEPKPWGPTPKKTAAFGPGCPQNCDLPPHTCPPATSEDCLFANVFTPQTASKLPVMVWIHGGHFDQGSGGCDLYDGTTLVKTGNVVIVTFSYRIGVLGWMATYDGLSGNYGFQDQLLALHWVQKNIAYFGGDPNAVTLFGQSAGGTSLRAHLVSPYSAGLFHKAIVHSDPLSLPMQPLADAQNWAVGFMQEIGCSSTACLRTQNVTAILAAQKLSEKHLNIARPLEVFLPLTPVVDKNFVPMHIFEALSVGKINKVPLIIGTTSQDALLFVYKGMKDDLNTVEYVGIVTAIFLSHFAEVLGRYPPKFIGDKRPEMSVLGTDYIFTCPTRSALQNYTSITNNEFPVWMWQWNHSLSWDAWGPSYPYCNGVPCHGAELPFLFDPPIISKYTNLTKDEQILADQVMSYWTNFAKNGDPNVGLPVDVKWPKWDAKNLYNLELQTPKNLVQSRTRADACDFWDTLGYHWGW